MLSVFFLWYHILFVFFPWYHILSLFFSMITQAICLSSVIVHAICFFFHDNTYYPSFCRPSKHFLLSKTSSRRLQDVFSVTLFVFQDLLKTSWRRLEDVFAIIFPKRSSRRLARRLQDVFARRLAIMSSRRLQDVLEDKTMLHWRRLEDVFSTSSPRRMFAGLKLQILFS